MNNCTRRETETTRYTHSNKLRSPNVAVQTSGACLRPPEVSTAHLARACSINSRQHRRMHWQYRTYTLAVQDVCRLQSWTGRPPSTLVHVTLNHVHDRYTSSRTINQILQCCYSEFHDKTTIRQLQLNIVEQIRGYYTRRETGMRRKKNRWEKWGSEKGDMSHHRVPGQLWQVWIIYGVQVSTRTLPADTCLLSKTIRAASGTV